MTKTTRMTNTTRGRDVHSPDGATEAAAGWREPAKATAIAVVVAVVANQAVRAVTVGLVDTSVDFVPMQVGPVLMFSVVPLVLAGLVALVLARFAPRPKLVFDVAAGALFLVSMVPVIALEGATEPELAGATAGHYVGITLLHLLPAALAIGLIGEALPTRRAGHAVAMV